MMSGHSGGFIMHLLRKAVIWTALAVFGFSIGAVYGSDVKNEAQATEALKKSGVPLHQDPQGVVRWIESTSGELSDESMSYLPAFPKLEWLEIGGGKVTSAGVAYLKNCTSLKRLYIHDINLKEDALEWLAGLTQLEALSLARTGIDGKALKNIKAASLTVLNLSGNPILNDDLKQIAKLKGLEVLALADTKINSASMHELEGMMRLNELNLMHCAITDDALASFMPDLMPNLRIVYAEGCSISDMGVIDMRTKFPMMAIFR
jgi:hypothetical protein